MGRRRLGVYCLLYGVAGALIGMAAEVLCPRRVQDDVFAQFAETHPASGAAGLVLAAASPR